MKLTHFISILILAILALVIGSVLVSEQQGEQSFEQKAFIANFDFTSVHQVILESSNEQVEMNKQLELWQVKQAHNYQANLPKLSELLQQLKDAKIQELKTSNAKHYHRLGLDGIESKDSNSILVTLSSGVDKVQLVIGDKAKSGSGQYARLLGNKQTFLLDKNIKLEVTPQSWLDKSVLLLGYSQIRSLKWKGDTDEGFEVVRNELEATGALEQQDGQPMLPKGDIKLSPEFELAQPKTQSQAKYASIFSGLVRSTVQLELQDVLPAALMDSESLKLSYSIEIGSKGQEKSHTTVMHFYQQGEEGFWLKLDGDKWFYQLSEFNFKQLAKPLSEYIESASE